MKMKIKGPSKSTLSACVLAAFTCSSVLSQEVQVVKIGHVAPLSGAQAHYGKDNENGVRMAIEDINAQNLVIGGDLVGRSMVRWWCDGTSRNDVSPYETPGPLDESSRKNTIPSLIHPCHFAPT